MPRGSFTSRVGLGLGEILSVRGYWMHEGGRGTILRFQEGVKLIVRMLGKR